MFKKFNYNEQIFRIFLLAVSQTQCSNSNLYPDTFDPGNI